MQDVLIIADLGAGGNLCRNLLLTNEHFDWPLASDRIETIKQQYQGPIALSQWLGIEYRLRFFEKYYAVDLSNELDWFKFQNAHVCNLKPRIFLNHSAFWQTNKLATFLQNFKPIYVSPKSDFALKWQLRSYVEKKTVQLLHDFCFDSDKEDQKKQYIKNNGLESYYRANITNMYHILKHRQKDLLDHLDNSTCHIALEIFLDKDVIAFVDKIKKDQDIDLDSDLVEHLLSQWHDLHWPIADVDNWRYHDCLS